MIQPIPVSIAKIISVIKYGHAELPLGKKLKHEAIQLQELAEYMEENAEVFHVRIEEQEPVEVEPEPEPEPEPINATSSAIMYAEANDIDLREVEGSGVDGRIVLNDIKE